MMTTLVRDIMHQGLITCTTNTPLGKVASLLAEYEVHALVVKDGDGKPAGIITDFDLLAGEWLSTDKESLAVMKNLTAGDLMTTPIDAIRADMSLQEAARFLQEKQVYRLAVQDGEDIAGVLSVSDIVATLAGRVRASRENVGDVMSDAFLVCRDKTPILSAARAMTWAHWRTVVVVNAQGALQGVFTSKDLLQFAVKDFDENLTVRSVLRPDPITIDIRASLQAAANLMIQHHLHRLIVVDRNEQDGFPLGIISASDIVAEMARPGSVWQV
ncbi:MAG TPA: CBS domain-containing protein [Nitrosospira sp.]